MTHKTAKDLTQAPARAAGIVREYGLFAGAVHGVTYDGRRIWAATGDRLLALEPGAAR